MPALRLRARSTSEIVDAAFTLYRRDPLLYILAALVGNLPSLVAELVATATGDGLSGGVAVLVLRLGAIVSYSFMSAVIIHMGSAAYLGETPDLAAALRATIARGLLIILGLLFLLVPGIWATAITFAMIPVVVLEGKGTNASFTRSRALSDGRKRHILNTLGLSWIVYFVVLMGVSVVAVGIAMGSTILSALFAAIAVGLLYPVIGLTELVLYYDARIRGEAFDLEVMQRQMDGAAPTAAPTA
jgi:hypothetical protein